MIFGYKIIFLRYIFIYCETQLLTFFFIQKALKTLYELSTETSKHPHS